ncbi:MAG: exodeoxyribonuclease VII large subunit [Armatimonadota bacterium]|nr:MAG: exodeoxyribonuclease VII large subunit [Armatimonadota bacterium]
MNERPAAPADRFIFSVRQLTRYVRALLERDEGLRDVWVRGEVSNCVRHTSGHVYFTLKDEASQIRCVAFREYAERMSCVPENGARILAHGSITVYERAGQYQLYVTEAVADGVGSLHLLFEQLKEKLRAEGLFDAARKRPIPSFPRRIAVVTSADGAVFHDFSVIAKRRWPGVAVTLVPAAVSGAGAAPSIVRALAEAAEVPDAEVIVLARGGGSLEELWAFNEEPVARAIAGSPVPVVSAVGHETDFTIADFVADLRAPTPSAAAEVLTPDAAAMCAHAVRLRERARNAVVRLLERHRRELSLLRGRRVLGVPAALLAEPRQRTDEALRRIRVAARQEVERRQARITALGERCRALDPLAVLSRGYCVMRLSPEGTVVRAVGQLSTGDETEVILHDGSAWCEVDRVVPREPEENVTQR